MNSSTLDGDQSVRRKNDQKVVILDNPTQTSTSQLPILSKSTPFKRKNSI